MWLPCALPRHAGLAAWLRGRSIHTVLVCGVATEFCVRATVLDSLAEGFRTVLLVDAGGGGGLLARAGAVQTLAAA